MMLNSLVGFGLPAPTEAALSPFQYHTEATVLTNECVRRTPTHLGGSQPLDARFVAVNGVTLPEWVRGPAVAPTGPTRADARTLAVCSLRQSGRLPLLLRQVRAPAPGPACPGARADARRAPQRDGRARVDVERGGAARDAGRRLFVGAGAAGRPQLPPPAAGHGRWWAHEPRGRVRQPYGPAARAGRQPVQVPAHVGARARHVRRHEHHRL